MGAIDPLQPLPQSNRASVADQVFSTLHGAILSLELPPGGKLTEVDVASQMGISRQPVRDAFYRLSKLGFLVIRPQRATTVSLISRSAVLRAQYVRTALETETVQTATANLSTSDFAAIGDLLDAQAEAQAADDKAVFQRLDDQFHQEICTRAGVPFAWELINETKAHMDRVRRLSLGFASRQALEEHTAVFRAMEQGDAAGAVSAMRLHLSRIAAQIDRLRAENHEWFENDEGQ